MRISDWSSDVCSSDLRLAGNVGDDRGVLGLGPEHQLAGGDLFALFVLLRLLLQWELGVLTKTEGLEGLGDFSLDGLASWCGGINDAVHLILFRGVVSPAFLGGLVRLVRWEALGGG